MNKNKTLKRLFFDNSLLLMGTSHIDSDINKKIKEIFEEFNPEIIGIELDDERYNFIYDIIKENDFREDLMDISKINDRLIEENQKNEDEELTPQEDFINIIRNFQWKLGNSKSSIPGNEFITAIILANKKNKEIFLIDQPITDIIEQLERIDPSKLNELLQDLFENADDGNFEINKKVDDEYKELMDNIDNEDYIKNAIEDFKIQSPELYDIFISSRDRKMASEILKIRNLRENQGKKILILIGAGHFDGISNILSDND